MGSDCYVDETNVNGDFHDSEGPPVFFSVYLFFPFWISMWLWTIIIKYLAVANT